MPVPRISFLICIQRLKINPVLFCILWVQFETVQLFLLRFGKHIEISKYMHITYILSRSKSHKATKCIMPLIAVFANELLSAFQALILLFYRLFIGVYRLTSHKLVALVSRLSDNNSDQDCVLLNKELSVLKVNRISTLALLAWRELKANHLIRELTTPLTIKPRLVVKSTHLLYESLLQIILLILLKMHQQNLKLKHGILLYCFKIVFSFCFIIISFAGAK